MYAWEKKLSVSFSRVYVCVKAKLTLVSFFLCTFPLATTTTQTDVMLVLKMFKCTLVRYTGLPACSGIHSFARLTTFLSKKGAISTFRGYAKLKKMGIFLGKAKGVQCNTVRSFTTLKPPLKVF